MLRQQLLEESSDVFELSEAFGQSECLTTRLKHITGTGPGPLCSSISANACLPSCQLRGQNCSEMKIVGASSTGFCG